MRSPVREEVGRRQWSRHGGGNREWVAAAAADADDAHAAAAAALVVSDAQQRFHQQQLGNLLHMVMVDLLPFLVHLLHLHTVLTV